jgi:hypothetical protein
MVNVNGVDWVYDRGNTQGRHGVQDSRVANPGGDDGGFSGSDNCESRPVFAIDNAKGGGGRRW